MSDMNRTYHDVQQGSPEWLALRAGHLTASEAPAMMGVSPYQTRAALIHAKHTGLAPEVDEHTQRRFDNGHQTEAAARPIAERIIGEDLYPATVSRTVQGLTLLASLDGMTMDGSILYEHKAWNETLAAAIRDGDPMFHVWQLEQQLLVTGAEKVLFMTSDGTGDRCEWMWYTPKGNAAYTLLAGWKQFQADLESYTPPAPEDVALEGSAPETLPALRIEVQGMVTASNLTEFKAAALSVIRGVNTDLQNDQDFADAEKAVKWAKDVETRLEAAKDHALSQTESIDALFRAIDEIREEARSKRLTLEKLVKARKEEIRTAIASEARAKWLEYIAEINAGLGKVRLPDVPIDIAGAMKGKKTVASLRDAADTELARAKIEAAERAMHIRASLEILRSEAKGYESLFADAQSLVVKAHDDLRAVIKARVSEHKEAERERQEQAERAMRERMEREARQKAESERVRIRAEEAARAKAETELRKLPKTTTNQPAPAKQHLGGLPRDTQWEPDATVEDATTLVVATFSVERPPGVSDAALVGECRRVMEAAGITTLTDVYVVRGVMTPVDQYTETRSAPSWIEEATAEARG